MIQVVKTDDDRIAWAASFFWWSRIYTGRQFDKVNPEMAPAILAHEAGHVYGHHTEWRFLCMLVFFPLIFCMCRKQELIADNYAARLGYGKILLKLLAHECDGGLFHPSHAVRRFHLEQYEQSRSAPVKGNSASSGVTG